MMVASDKVRLLRDYIKCWEVPNSLTEELGYVSLLLGHIKAATRTDAPGIP